MFTFQWKLIVRFMLIAVKTVILTNIDRGPIISLLRDDLATELTRIERLN